MKLFTTVVCAAALVATAAAAAQTPAPQTPPAAEAQASAKLSVETTPIEEILENPKAMEILYKHFPEMKGQEDQLAMAGSMTMRDVQQFAADSFTDEKLAAVEADFAAMP